MGGHEGNTDSIPKRCVFLITLFTTVYGMIILNDNWPKTPLEPNAALEVLNLKATNLKELLLSMDSFYNVEINADHHDDDHLPGHGDHHGHDDSHASHEDNHAGHDGHAAHAQAKNDHEAHAQTRGDFEHNVHDLELDPDMELISDSELEDQARLYEEYLQDEAAAINNSHDK